MARATADKKLMASLSLGSGSAGPRAGSSGRDASEVLEAAEGVLDEVAFTVAVLVEDDGLLAIGPAGDHRLGAVLAEILAQVVGVVALVAEEVFDAGQGFDQRRGGRDVGDIARREDQAEGAADDIGKRMNFRGFPAAREADRLGLRPPFPPKAERCALM